MKLGELSRDDLPALPDDVKTRIVFGGTYPTGGNSIAALLLGCGTAMEMTERALAAAALFKAGRTSRIIPTGGPVRQTEWGDMTEAAYMAAKLREAGIPDEFWTMKVNYELLMLKVFIDQGEIPDIEF